MPSPNGYPMSRRTFSRLLFGFGSNSISNQVYSMEVFTHFDIHLDKDIESFQYKVFSQFKKLSDSSDDELLSFNWLSKLLDAFLACHQDFEDFLLKHTLAFSKPPLDYLVNEFFEKSIKALDICNAVCDGIEKIRRSHKYLQIVSDALNSKHKKLITKGQFRRARKALTDLNNVTLENNNAAQWFFLGRFKSFGHSSKRKDLNRSISRSISSNSWSTSKQLQSMVNGLILPRASEVTATRGLVNVIFTMSFVQMFVMWALAASIDCQDRGSITNFTIPNNYLWGSPLSVIYTRIINESKKCDRKNNVGLLKEIYQMEKTVHFVTYLVDSSHQFPLTEEHKEKVRHGANEVSIVSDAHGNWLYPFECQVRQVFHKIISCRLEGLENLCRTSS
ncbi:protein ROH1D-like [Rutidosis leptorrhynchoides]|uniref:protein ROH1D-like n=1 Tax=Rutidosis leptorrhynchoides TaxID=125765 RepID=UPI003A990C65